MRKGFVFSCLLTFAGLGLAVWWMVSAEETIISPVKTSSKQVTWTQNKTLPKTEVLKKDVQGEPAEQKKKLAELQQILDSKNDNDPRLDTDFKALTDDEKVTLKERYLSYKPESLNERGTLVFLLGRNLKSEEDVKFLGQVLKESPCLSLANCAAAAPKATGEAAHEASVNDVTLAYPQVVSIKSIENLLFQGSVDPKLRPLIMKTLEEASHSQNQIVAHMARSTIEKSQP